MPTISCPPMRYQSNLDNNYYRMWWGGDEIVCYNACFGATTCTDPSVTDLNSTWYQQLVFSGSCHIFRKGIFLDTSAINPNWIIDSAKLFLWLGTAHWGSGNFAPDWLKLVSAPACNYPAGGILVDDYGYLAQTAIIYSQYFDTDNVDPALTEIDIPYQFLGDINKGGITSFAARTGKDYAGLPPSNPPWEWDNIYTGISIGWYDKYDSGTQGYLEVDYHIAGKNITLQSRSIPATMISF